MLSANPPNKPVKFPIQPCPKKTKPCDIAEMTVERVAMPRGKGPVDAGSGTVKEAQKPYTLKLSAIQAGKAPAVIQVIAGPMKPGVGAAMGGASVVPKKKKIKLTSSMSAGPCSPSLCPELKITGCPQALTYIGPGKCAKVEFEVHRNEGPSAVSDLIRSAWPPLTPVKHYSVNIMTCGCRPGGKVVCGGNVNIEAFPCEQYSLKIQLPSWSKRAASINKTTYYKGDGRERENERSIEKGGTATTLTTTYKTDGTIDSKATKQTDSTKSELATGKYGGRQWIISGKEPPKDQVVFELCRDGTQEKTGGNVVELYNWIVYTAKMIDDLKDKVQRFVPQVGAKFDWSVSFLSGTLNASWGYQECDDHRVFFAWAVELGMDLVRAEINFSFGFEIPFFCVAKLYFKLSGSVAAKISRKREAISDPEGGKGTKTKVSGSIEGEIGGVAEVGVGWIKASKQAGAKSGIKVEGLSTFRRLEAV